MTADGRIVVSVTEKQYCNPLPVFLHYLLPKHNSTLSTEFYFSSLQNFPSLWKLLRSWRSIWPSLCSRLQLSTQQSTLDRWPQNHSDVLRPVNGRSRIYLLHTTQYDWCSWIPNAPSTMRRPPPDQKGLADVNLIVDSLPDRGRSSWHLGAVWALSQYQENEVICMSTHTLWFSIPRKHILNDFSTWNSCFPWNIFLLLCGLAPF